MMTLQLPYKMAEVHRISRIFDTTCVHLPACFRYTFCSAIVPITVISRSTYFPRNEQIMDAAWEKCMMNYLQKLYDRSHSTKTVEAYRYPLQFFFRAYSAKHPQDVTREDIAVFIHLPCAGQNRAGQPPSISTVNIRLLAIKGLYDFAALYTIEGTDGKPQALFVGTNPALGFTYGKPKRAYRVLSHDELDALFSVIPTGTVKGLRDRAIFLFYFWTARRREEVARLRWGNLSYGPIMDETGVHMGYLYTFRGKGHSEQDDIAELPALAKAALDKYLIASGRMEHMTADSPLFVPIKGDMSKPLDTCTIAKHLKAYARSAGLHPEKVCIHSFRHTAAQQRYQAGQGVLELKQLLRHTSLDTTWVYLHSLVGVSDNGAKLLESRFAHL